MARIRSYKSGPSAIQNRRVFSFQGRPKYNVKTKLSPAVQSGMPDVDSTFSLNRKLAKLDGQLDCPMDRRR